ncbi:phosphatase IMPL1, chloroplastic-like [Camellia sinensis]|uniref:phosphatase IMPL1, chloroplastic-like n=1 Tax=Camellia sinensis TaxID=4442 RepID=UPI0010360231|nr:phosphatase IMPL1, chloroplastic-like [Camellia sinensis]
MGINNNYLRLRGALFFIIALDFAISGGDAQNSTTLAPTILTFGDPTVDVGNNDHIHTIVKANFPPHGKDFINHKPTGRFCNVKLATDITAGTRNFAHCYPSFAVFVGVLYKGKSAAGAMVEFVGAPMCWNTHTFSATAGGGAFCNGQKIQMSHTDKGIRRLGAAAVDMCHVALEIVEPYLEYHLKPWDMVARVLVKMW